MTRPTTQHQLDLIAWNCYVANSDRNVHDTLAGWAMEYEPDVFTLSEARTHAGALAAFCDGFAYTLLQQTPARRRRRAGVVVDTGDSAILVANHVTVRRNRTARMRRSWLVIRHRRRHTPREYEVVALRVRGHRWRVCAPHPPTGGFDGGNEAAFRESARWLRRWLLRTGPWSSAVAAGDLNERKQVLAGWLGRRFRVFGAGIDVALTRRVRVGRCIELGKGGSDHHGRHYTFTA